MESVNIALAVKSENIAYAIKLEKITSEILSQILLRVEACANANSGRTLYSKSALRSSPGEDANSQQRKTAGTGPYTGHLLSLLPPATHDACLTTS